MLPQSKALTALKAVRTPLLAVVDAAQGSKTRKFLGRSLGSRRSLYEGPEAKELAEVAPYLLELTDKPRLLERLVEQGWGENWAIFLTATRPFLEVRRQLRKHLIVMEEETKKRLFFRFYDPRVLRVFLPTCEPEQSEQFYGFIDAFFAEGKDGDLLHFPKPEARRA
jgi:Domain of unknown function (DUF4123)